MSADVEMHEGGQPSLEDILDEKYPNRPHNHSKTLPFHDLFLTLFNPLNENRKKPAASSLLRRKQGPHGSHSMPPNEVRKLIIQRFISRWRKEVGDDIYPAMRLIVPEKDRDRGMYGLKEKAIGKLLVRVMKIDKNSEDGYNLLNWKLPGQNVTSRLAGDFASRCFEIVSKRPIQTAVGDMTIAEVNDKLDQLAAATKEEDQLPVFQLFYHRMNPEELKWLIRIMLRQMKVGATEKTIFEIWHPDAELLFNISSSLRRVCWELHDRSIRLEGDEADITLMQCFQPQLAQFQMFSFEKMVQHMRPTEDDDEFWIEEKLDGERMQLHMIEDESVRGGKRFAFWSRKAKEYTYLYGNGFFDDKSALTRHIQGAFHSGVRNIILDGEMITWDPELDVIVGFGTLKTAALSEQRNEFSTGHRPLFRVFDILYLNDQALTKYTLRDRRKALETSIKNIHRRLEIHTYAQAHYPTEIEPALRQVVATASEGLVLKNPRSMYRLNSRNDDWMKVKPEYMTEFGEALDCLIIGGYYGSGHRGGKLSSFLCGLRVDGIYKKPGDGPMKFFSFFKVGGGFSASDYAAIRHSTDGKWKDWDPKKPPTEYIELAGGDKQFERPDMWIKPDDSVVVEAKAASVSTSESFRVDLTLRFPRFVRIRTDRTWESALTLTGFKQLRNSAEKEKQEKKFTIDNARKTKRARTTVKRPLIITGADNGHLLRSTAISSAIDGSNTVFQGLNIYIMTEALAPYKKTKVELEAWVKAHGGKIFQSPSAASNIICIADRNLVKVASLQKTGTRSIIRPAWLFDCVTQAQRDRALGRPPALLTYEPRHCLYVAEADQQMIAQQVDHWGDSYARDMSSIEELREIFDGMPAKFESSFPASRMLDELLERGHWRDDEPIGWMLRGTRVFFDRRSEREPEDNNAMAVDADVGDAKLSPNTGCSAAIVVFAGGEVAERLERDTKITHIAVDGDDRARLKKLRATLASRSKLPRLVTVDWILQSWAEGTRLDEERFAPI